MDNATADIIVRLVNPDPIDGPSQFNDVVLTNYRVTYELPTGPGTPGTDVPLPFDGNFSTVLCQVDEETAVPFVVVLEAAKLAAPLSALVGTTTVLERKAKIEIFGHDLTDHPVTATGYLTIYFADYADIVPDQEVDPDPHSNQGSPFGTSPFFIRGTGNKKKTIDFFRRIFGRDSRRARSIVSRSAALRMNWTRETSRTRATGAKAGPRTSRPGACFWRRARSSRDLAPSVRTSRPWRRTSARLANGG